MTTKNRKKTQILMKPPPSNLELNGESEYVITTAMHQLLKIELSHI